MDAGKISNLEEKVFVLGGGLIKSSLASLHIYNMSI